MHEHVLITQQHNVLSVFISLFISNRKPRFCNSAGSFAFILFALSCLETDIKTYQFTHQSNRHLDFQD